MKKWIIGIVTLVMLMIITTGGVMASGFDLSFYKALEGQKISIVDANGNIIETTTIDSMGNANFKNSMIEGQKLDMNLDTPEDMDTINQRVVYGYELKTVIGVAASVGFIIFIATYLFMKHTITSKYEYLEDYAYNENLDPKQ